MGPPAGLLDDSLELALPIIENELFGEVAEAKEVAVFANNYKEAKRVREARWRHAACCCTQSQWASLHLITDEC
jgi:hypothetical protein